MYVQQDSIPPPKKYTYFVDANIFLEEKTMVILLEEETRNQGKDSKGRQNFTYTFSIWFEAFTTYKYYQYYYLN